MAYVKQNFVDGDILYANQLNHIEDGIVANEVSGVGDGFHNSVFRGKNLGSSYTAAQQAAVANGTFDDLFIGDYWEIGGVKWQIAHFDYYYNCGDTALTKHHIVVVPANNFYNHVMNDTDVVTGAYYGSKMKAEGLATWNTRFNTAFGNNHRVNHRNYYITAVNASGNATAGEWHDSDGCDLMTERNVYGTCIRSINYDFYTIDKSQYALFAYDSNAMFSRTGIWLQDIFSSAAFCIVGNFGDAYSNGASVTWRAVRPRFLLS